MPKDKTENHEKIISSARKEFMTYSFKDASMRRIAADSGMSVSGLYKHFPLSAYMVKYGSTELTPMSVPLKKCLPDTLIP